MARSTFLALLLPTLPLCQSLRVLSCYYGFSQCLGHQPSDGLDEVRQLGCPTSADGEYGGMTQDATMNMFNPMMLSNGVSLANSTSSAHADGMPCTFHPDDSIDELATLQLPEIVVHLTDDTLAVVEGATWLPAVEPNEQRTLLLVGNFGYRDGKELKSVTIRDSTYSGPALHFENQGEILLWAQFRTVAEHAALDTTDFCDTYYPETTHVVQVVADGGLAVSFSDNPDLAGPLDNNYHRSMFELRLPGSNRVLQLGSEYLGMADIADQDNYLDLCLKLVDSDVEQMSEEGLEVRMYSTRECWIMVPPKGDCMNDLVGAPCGDSASKPQKICVRGLPGASVDDCDVGGAVEFTPTDAELEALGCPGDDEASTTLAATSEAASTTIAATTEAIAATTEAAWVSTASNTCSASVGIVAVVLAMMME